MDMLIKLYELPNPEAFADPVRQQRIQIRRAMAYERGEVKDWVRQHFNAIWAEECATAFGRQPIGCYLAVNETTICGFCCLDVTYRNFIGPIGIERQYRGKGVGRSLLLSVAKEIHASGFAYAIIGDVGEPEFFRRTVNALDIPNSTPGPYPPRVMGDGT